MAEIQDIDGNDAGNSLDANDIGEMEAVEQASNSQPEESELPQKYRGKSVSDIVKMHQEAEKLIERQGREVGEVRKLADELIKSQLTPRREETVRDDVDFFENPEEAIRRQIDNHPRVQAAEAYAIEARRAQSQQEFFRRHPDAGNVLNDAGFQEWVKASKVRSQLFELANSAYDVDAGDELLSTYKELKSVRQQKVSAADNVAREKSLSAAAVSSGGSGESSRKMYRRADLIELRMKNPAKYEAMSDEIYRAYAEGRVK